MPTPLIRVLTILLIMGLGVQTACSNHKADVVSAAASNPRIQLGLTVKPVQSGQCCTDKDEQVRDLLLVTRVRPASLAEKMGVRPGDLLHTIAGHPVTGITDAYASLNAVDRKESVSLGVFRDQKLIILGVPSEE